MLLHYPVPKALILAAAATATTSRMHKSAPQSLPFHPKCDCSSFQIPGSAYHYVLIPALLLVPLQLWLCH